LRVAREIGLRGCESISVPASTSVVAAWRQVCAAAGITENELARELARYLRMEVATDEALSAEVSHSIPESLLERYGVRVVGNDSQQITVATANPLDADAEQALRFAARRRIEFVIATPRALNLEAASPAEPELEELLSQARIAPDAVHIEEPDEEIQPVDLDDASSEPVIRLANLILREAVRQDASDVHLSPDQGRGVVRFRVDGMLRPFMHIPLNALNRVISRYKVVCRLNIADRVRPQDGSVRIRVDGRSYEVRLSTVPTQDAEKAVIRLAGGILEQTIDRLGIQPPELAKLKHLLSYRDGIIVVTGPTGSGKTTTLYAALNELNTGTVNIVTVEDPIERTLPGITQIQVQPRRGVTFASALRAILRQDPDIILLGEIRDLETAEIAVQAATTGHLVLTTLHTTTAVGVITRLRDLGLDSKSLSASLRGIIAQRLARRKCAACHGAACEQCGGTGYRGRLPLLEVLEATSEFNELVGRGALHHELQRAAERTGMRSLATIAAELVAKGLTTQEETSRVLGEVAVAGQPAVPLPDTNGSGVAPQLEALERSADGAFLTDSQGVVQWANRTWTELTGYDPAEILGRTHRMWGCGAQDPAIDAGVRDAIERGQPWRGELECRRKDGSKIYVELTVTPFRNAEGDLTYVLFVQRDVSERRRRKENVERLVASDPLTGLPNERGLVERLQQAIAAAAAGNAEASLVIMHVDGAASLAESLRPSDAAALAREVARKVATTLRPTDFLARLGDFEFAALLPGTPPSGASKAVERLGAAIGTMEWGGQQTDFGLRTGIAVVDGTESARAVLEMAEATLYAAPAGAVESNEAVEPRGNGLTEAAAEWRDRIIAALEEDHFFLHFQPVVRLDTRTLSHFDVLLRLHDDNGDVIPARAFITHAENVGLMQRVDRWVVENVLRLLQASPDLRMAVNLGRSTLLDADFMELMRRRAQRTAAVVARLILEVDGPKSADDLPGMAAAMHELRALGCRFVLDHFGVSNESLASVGALPVDYVKLDSPLVNAMDADGTRTQLVRSLTTLARALGKDVIGGYAERAEVIEQLHAMGVAMAQGHFLGHPGPE
ncbi:MAG TPA: ATPase, T2SS/T4P/T4SS family, partial [Longimicrobiales bacterium]|nr:ATPase, T2SS/T4P/T4SS family [Longimicrobiales bacterium]